MDSLWLSVPHGPRYLAGRVFALCAGPKAKLSGKC